MRISLRTLLMLLALEGLLLACAVPIVRELRHAKMRASCVNGLKEQVREPVR